MNARHIWKATEATRRPYYRSAQRIFKRGLAEQFKSVIEYVNSNNALDIETAINQILEAPIEDAFNYVYGEVGPDFAQREFSKFAGQANDAMRGQFDQFFQDYVRENAATRVTSITGISKDYARKIIYNAVAEGGDIGTGPLSRNIAKDLRIGGAKISNWRARVIARTEVVSASNVGQQVGAEATGQQMLKTWLPTIDNNTRPSHMINDTIPMDEYFKVGGDELYVPGDPNGSPEEVINCRCTLTYEVI